MKLLNENLQKIYLFYILYLFTIPFGLLIRLLYTRSISVEEVGIIYSLVSFFNFFLLFTRFGFSKATMYFIPKYLLKKDLNSIRNIFYFGFIIQIISSIFLFILFLFFKKYILIYYFHNLEIILYFEFFLIYFIFLNFNDSISNIFKAYNLNKYYQSMTFLQLFLTFIFSIILFYSIDGNLSIYYSLIWVISAFIIFIISLYLLIKKFPYLLKKPTFNKKLFSKFMNYSKYMFLSELGIKILAQIDILIITYFLGSISVAYYSNIFSFVMILTSLASVSSIFFLPYFSELNEKKDYQKIKYILNFIYNSIFFIFFPLLITFFIFSKSIIILFFGTDYLNSYIILKIFSLFIIFRILNFFNLNFMAGLGLERKIPKIILPIIFFNTLIDIILIKLNFNLIGVTIGTIISWIFIFIFTYTNISKKTNFKLEYKKIFLIFLLNIFYYLELNFLFENFVFMSFYFYFFIICFLLYVKYIILGYLFKIFTKRDIFFILPKFNIFRK